MNIVEHLLVCANEEGLEIGQAADKALRFGLEDMHPKTGTTTLSSLVAEINDLLGVIELMQDHGVKLEGLFDRLAIEKKKAKVLIWMEYSRKAGTLQDS